jgi:hypothetical protein
MTAVGQTATFAMFVPNDRYAANNTGERLN